ncbi:MAG: pnp [Chlamydiales bacterium]|jgi:polyribonucleotide nucleotidyltransferase|nr:pnp [Chlamydiales bacterium]
MEMDTIYPSLERHSLTVVLENQELTFETGKIARQANGAVLVKCGETYVFATACAKSEAAPDIDFLPLRVDYYEKLSSVGRTPGGFIKREGKSTEREILVSRLIDRPLRPMFPEGYFHEVQLLSYVWSYDGVNLPEPLAICATSAALVVSDIPLVKPVAGVRVGKIEGKLVINPTVQQMKHSALDLVLAGTEDAILMIEGYCNFLTEEEVLEAVEYGHKSIRIICQHLAAWQKEVGKQKKVGALATLSEQLYQKVEEMVKEPLLQALKIRAKSEREAAISAIHLHLNETLLTAEGDVEPEFKQIEIARVFSDISARYMRQMILCDKTRCDGRGYRDIRPIDIEQSLLPRTHGSSLFTRGETQALAVCTLGTDNMAQRSESLEGEVIQRFYLQYFFPPSSVGEVSSRSGPPGRREIGHSKLAERAILAALPEQSAFPYTIRLESNITESNGSSSMASVCGGCLALMDAGVPIQRPVSGIAMGLILEGDEYVVLSDILGIEDALGDMDFKITGDDKGITAFQMDIKVEGITIDIMRVALAQARDGRLHILQKMLGACPGHKKQLSLHAPRIETLYVKSNKIAIIIGPGGKQIREITALGVEVNINDTLGKVDISSNNAEALERAKAMIQALIMEPEIMKVYQGKVVSITPFGAFVEIYPGKEGLCHISELDHARVEKVTDIVKEGEIISVKLLEINEKGQLKLSRRATLPRPTSPQAQG